MRLCFEVSDVCPCLNQEGYKDMGVTILESRRIIFLAFLFSVILLSCGNPSDSAPSKTSPELGGFPEPDLKLPIMIGEADAPAMVFSEFVERFRQGTLDSPEGRALLSESAKKMAQSEKLDMRVVFDKIIMIDESNAVARLIVEDKKRNVDLYFYLRKDEVWRVRCTRALALTGILTMILDEYEKDPSQFKDDDTDIENIKLTLSPDLTLIRWFAKHFDELQAIATAERLRHSGGSGWSKDKIQEMCEALHVTAAFVTHDGLLRITIGGIVDNMVGFLFVGDSDPPAIEDDDYIWLEKVAEGWFFFKTT